MFRIFRDLQAIMERELEPVIGGDKKVLLINTDIAADKIIKHLMDNELINSKALLDYCDNDPADYLAE